MSPVAAVISVCGKTNDADSPGYAEVNLMKFEGAIRRAERCALLPCTSADELRRHLSYAASLCTQSSRLICVPYVGDVALLDGDVALVFPTTKFKLFSEIKEHCVNYRDIQFLIVLDTACYRIQASKKNVKPDSMEAAATDLSVAVLWPSSTVAGTTLLREEDEDDSGKGEGHDLVTFGSELAKQLSMIPNINDTQLSALGARVNETLTGHGVPVTLSRFLSPTLKSSVIQLPTVSTLPRENPEVQAATCPRPVHAETAQRTTIEVQHRADAWSTNTQPAVVVQPPLQRAFGSHSADLAQSTSKGLDVTARPFQPPAESPPLCESMHATPSSTQPPPPFMSGMPGMPGMPNVPPFPFAPQGFGGQFGGAGRKGVHHCNVCNCDVFGDQNWALHLTSEKHRRKEILANPGLAGAVLDPTTTALLVNPRNFFKCDVCNVVISGQTNIQQHLSGQQHRRNQIMRGMLDPNAQAEYGEQQQGDDEEDEPMLIECRTCMVQFGSVQELMEHQSTSAHITATMRQQYFAA
jgi:hypothetical protein